MVASGSGGHACSRRDVDILTTRRAGDLEYARMRDVDACGRSTATQTRAVVGIRRAQTPTTTRGRWGSCCPPLRVHAAATACGIFWNGSRHAAEIMGNRRTLRKRKSDARPFRTYSRRGALCHLTAQLTCLANHRARNPAGCVQYSAASVALQICVPAASDALAAKRGRMWSQAARLHA